MSDKVKERIEKDGEAYAKSINSSDGTARFDYIAGASSERPKAWNEAIDACIEIFRSAPWDQNIIPLVEKLKHKQP